MSKWSCFFWKLNTHTHSHTLVSEDISPYQKDKVPHCKMHFSSLLTFTAPGIMLCLFVPREVFREKTVCPTMSKGDVYLRLLYMSTDCSNSIVDYCVDLNIYKRFQTKISVHVTMTGKKFRNDHSYKKLSKKSREEVRNL